MPKKETKTLVLTLLLIDLISIGIFVFIYSYTKNLIEESVNSENSIKTELKKEDSGVLMKADIAAGVMYREKLMEYVVQSGGTVDFIKVLEQLVSNSGIKSDVKNVSSSAYSKGDAIGMEVLTVDMDVLGEWKNLQFFLASLESYPLKIDIKKVSFSKFSDYIINGRKVPQWSGAIEFTVVKMKDIK